MAALGSWLAASGMMAQSPAALPRPTRSAPTSDPSIPLTTPILVPGPTGLREVAPRTPEYYDLRIKGRYYLQGGQLRSGFVLRGRILECVDATHLRVREHVLRREEPPAQGYSAWVDTQDYLVTVLATNGWTIGQSVEWLLDLGPGAACRLADGSEIQLPNGRQVAGVSFAEYLSGSRQPPPDPPASPAIVSFRLNPTEAERLAQFREEAARLRATPEGQRIMREVAAEGRQEAARRPAKDTHVPRVIGTVTPVTASATPIESPAAVGPVRIPQ